MENSLEYVSVQLQEVREKIAQAEKVNHRQPGAVKLLAVSKTFPNEAILAAYAAGQRAFGENKVAELEEKATVLPGDIQWHLIGHLQSNKVARAVRYASWIHSVDSIKLLERIDRLAGEEGRHPNILLEVNVSGEASKDGISPEELNELAAAAAAADHVTWQGLMTMAPLGADAAVLDRVFSTLRDLELELRERFALPLPELSMGMSGDFTDAIRCGSTIVRIGTAIFGMRNYGVRV